MSRFLDRRAGGRVLAPLVQAAVRDTSAIVLALPRGGVPVGFEIAASIDADLDVLVVRKLGLPGEEELAIGAIASGGIRVLNRELIRFLKVPPAVIDSVTERELIELQRREQLYREGRPALNVQHRTVVLTDDGLATGATMLAAVRAIRAREAQRIIVAVPVAAKPTYERFRKDADDIVCAALPEDLGSVGAWYENFSPTSDYEVRDLLQQALSRRTQSGANASNTRGAPE